LLRPELAPAGKAKPGADRQLREAHRPAWCAFHAQTPRHQPSGIRASAANRARTEAAVAAQAVHRRAPSAGRITTSARIWRQLWQTRANTTRCPTGTDRCVIAAVPATRPRGPHARR
jgi:hypothetical protein